VLGLVVNTLENAILATIAETLQRVGFEHGYQFIVGSSGRDPKRESALLQYAVRHRFEGVVLVGTGHNATQISRMLDFGIAVVTLVRDVPGATTIHVSGAYRQGARLAVGHLADYGHKSIAYIGPTRQYSMGNEMYSGFVEELALRQLPFHESLVYQGPYDPSFGYRSAEAILGQEARPTAILVGNIEAMHGVLRSIQEHGLSVPQQISVLCMEDSPVLSWSSPQITVVDTAPQELALAGFRLLLSKLESSYQQRVTVTAAYESSVELCPTLIGRGSVDAPLAA